MTLESLARTISRAIHGTDYYWVEMLPASEAALRDVVEHILTMTESVKNDALTDDNVDALMSMTGFEYELRALLAQPDGDT